MVYNAVTSRKNKEIIYFVSQQKSTKDIMLYKIPLQNVHNFTTYNVWEKITPNDVRLLCHLMSNYVDLFTNRRTSNWVLFTKVALKDDENGY